MIEFFISKLWALISGMAVLSVVATSIFGAVHVSSDLSREGMLERLVQDIDEMDGDCQAHLEIVMDDILLSEEVLMLRNGSVWLIGDGYLFARNLPTSSLVLDGDGTPLAGESNLTLTAYSVLVLDMIDRNGVKWMVLYEAKTSTSLFTASTNLLASSTVL